ncbi:AhpC/TSA family protein [Sphingobacterium sp. N143]|uniref:TlpA disulfide reductase family protein n=1 Tax=Sphingobacterium sp. N143 TaxID=2746727 RepID=UPI00257829BB|nr:TlpA disulfide reductase family protein [Sphingobacterium sp. N143]MDM1294203.1 AhpC/TSA family protein [Sphingobacterium sp. N143]
MIKKIFTCIYLALGIAGTAIGQDHDFQFNIKGSPFPAKAKIFVRYMVDSKLTFDSLDLSAGQIRYKGKIAEPTQVMLFYSKEGISFFNRKAGPLERLTFYVDPLEADTEIEVKIPFESSQVKAGKLQVAYQKYQDYLRPYDRQLSIQQSKRADLYEAKSQDTQALKQIAAEIDRVEALRNDAQRSFAAQNPDNYFSLLSLREIARYGDELSAIEPIFLKLSPDLRGTAIGKTLQDEIQLAKKLGIGQPAPDFEQLTPDGKALKLSDFRGKYLLLDFWASWCAPCRAENPHLIEVYKEFKGQSFEILGVSLDKPGKKDNWIKAIDQDGLTWPQVSDLNGWQSKAAQLYGIQAIPQNYLISPEGKIIGVNLKGKQLNAKLAELIKK